MFKKIVLDNYKSFRHIEIDLTGAEKKPLDHAFIYGENGSGKSNLIESMMFLKDSMKTVGVLNRLRAFADKHDALKNIDQKRRAAGNSLPKQPEPDQNEIIKIRELLDTMPFDLSAMAEGVRTIDPDAGLSASYHFVINGYDGCYEMRFGNDNRLIYEKLNFVVESRAKDIFEISSSEIRGVAEHQIRTEFSPQLFLNKKYKDGVADLIKKYWGRHTFMSILDNEYSLNNAGYMKESLGTGIADVMKYFDDLVVSYNFDGKPVGRGIADKILSDLDFGRILPEEKAQLSIFEKALNSFFTRIYSDVKKAYYRTETVDGMLQYTLCFSKMIGGKRREIEIYRESAGTKRLLGLLFPAFFECARGKTVFLDELDSGVHDRLIKDVVSDLKDTFKGQFVATTHNTSLLEVIDPKNIFVIQIDPRGEKRILSLNKIERTQRNHNNRIRYMNGVFSAVPILGEIDFDDIVRRADGSLRGMK